MDRRFASVFVTLGSLSCANGSTVTDPWTELCAAATIEENQAVIPIDRYCQHFECPDNLTNYEAYFTTCDSPTDEYPVCAWEREVGCGVVQITRPNDESSFYAIAFNASDGSLLGFIQSSDSSLRRCGAFDYRVGRFKDYSYRRNPPCESVEKSNCCHRDPPHEW